MMDIDTNFFNSSDEDDHDEESVLSPIIKFWILLISSIPSIICSLIVLWLILNNREQRRSLNYHIIIIQILAGLIYLLIHVSLYLNYLRLDYVWPETPAICQLWWFVGDGYADTMTILMAWGSFERHILIFHDRWISTARKRLFVHYLPIALIIIYCPFYYVIVMAFPPCENNYDYSENQCSASCLYRNEVLLMYDTIFNDILATLLVAIFSISLIVRIIWHQHMHLRGRIQLSRHRKIILILLSISIIYLVFNLPMMILDLLELCGLSNDSTEHIEEYLDFLNYFIFILYPFICLSILSKKLWNRRTRRLVNPMPLTMTNNPKHTTQRLQASTRM